MFALTPAAKFVRGIVALIVTIAILGATNTVLTGISMVETRHADEPEVLQRASTLRLLVILAVFVLLVGMWACWC